MPAIVNGTPTDVRNREATLHFSIDPGGLATKYYVEYGTTTSYGQRAGLYEEDLAAGDDPVALTELLSVWYLQPGTTYHYRVVAANDDGTTYGADQEVTSADGPVPAVVTGEATDDTGSAVVLHGTVDPEGEPLTACRFRYVTLSEYDRFGFATNLGPRPEPKGVEVPCEESLVAIGDGEEPVPVHAVVEDYGSGVHKFRLEAENAYDEANATGAGTFGFPPPAIEYLAPSPRNYEATVHFTIDPQGQETEYEVEYGPLGEPYYEMNYFWNGTLPAEGEPVALEATFPAYWEGSLLPGTTYHWRVVARSAGGVTEGPDETFTTTSGLKPKFATSAWVVPATTVATKFAGTVDPEGSELTGCRFRWVTESVFKNAGFEKWAAWQMQRFGDTVPCAESFEEIGSGTDPVPVHAVVSGLEPGRYYLRLEGENDYVDTAGLGGAPFDVVVPGGSAPSVPGQRPAQPVAQGSDERPTKKKRKKKRRQRLHRNAALSARR